MSSLCVQIVESGYSCPIQESLGRFIYIAQFRRVDTMPTLRSSTDSCVSVGVCIVCMSGLTIHT